MSFLRKGWSDVKSATDHEDRIEKSDVLLLLGLMFLGTGLYLLFGPGWALVVAGGLVFLMGFLANIAGRPAPPPKAES